MRILCRIAVSVVSLLTLVSIGFGNNAEAKPKVHTARKEVPTARQFQYAVSDSAILTLTKDQEEFIHNNRIELALAMWAEARADGLRGMHLVGDVVLNRVANGTWGSTVHDVTHAKGQFSRWPWSYKINTLRYAYKHNLQLPDDLLAALYLADELLTAEARHLRVDQTYGSLFFLERRLGRPSWTRAMMEVMTFRHHRFLIGTV